MNILELFDRHKSGDWRLRSPYIIAEAGVNHEGDMDIAKRLIEEAAEGGAQAIKFQTYKAETLAAKHSPAYWDRTQEPTGSQYELFKKYDSFWKKEHEQLKVYCDKAGIEFMSTPFDVESAIFLNDLMPVFKISSSDITNKPFIELMCGFGKPIILSTGASYMWETEQAVEWIREFGNPLCLMHCILNYPTQNINANLGMLLHLRQKFPSMLPGYSDHTFPQQMEVVKMSVLLGARIIEKHFTHDKTLPGNDHYHAMDMEDLKLFWKKNEAMFELLGSFDKQPLESEAPARKNARRSLIAAVDIAEGTIVEAQHLTWKRPAFGISPKHYDEVLGTKAATNIAKDAILQWQHLKTKKQ